MMRLKCASKAFTGAVAIVGAFIVILCSGSCAPAAATLQGLQTGMEAPPFSLNSIGGQSFRTFEDLKGERLTVLVFWSTWNPKSEKALMRMQKLYEKYRDAGLAIVGVNVDGQALSDTSLKEIQEVQVRLKITFPMLVDHGLETFHSYGIIALPTTVVMDRERVILYELSGYPTVSSERLADFMTSVLEGAKAPVAGEKTGYRGNKTAHRCYNMGKATLDSKRMTATAEKWFKRAVEADADFILPRLSLARLYAQRGDLAAASLELREVLAREPGHSAALCESGMIMLSEGRTAEGMALLEAGRQAEHAYPPCYYYAGSAFAKEGKVEQAVKMFDEAETANPFDYRNFEHKGRFYGLQKDYKKSSEAYRKSLELILQVSPASSFPN